MPDDNGWMVPVGMTDLFDDWAWSPDAARWDPDLATGIDPERSTPSWPDFAYITVPDFAYITVRIDTEAFDAAMAAVRESLSRMVVSPHRMKFGAAATLEVLDEALPSGPPTDVRGRALWLRQHRNTGPDRDRWPIDQRRRA